MRRNYLFLAVLILSGCAAPLQPQRPARSQEMVFQALASAGVPYRRGGDSPENGFDCSGLVAHVYREAFGIELPHNALAQSRMGRHVTLSQLEAGDLVFYNTERRPYSHVGIFLRKHARSLLGETIRRSAAYFPTELVARAARTAFTQISDRKPDTTPQIA